ncbi:MAG: class II fructose-bisphosphate aldolase [Candidatus Kaelpia imicola]|nr:class II fructose-bisphosphate aldolase [Candidatus Kaelpia imicola]
MRNINSKVILASFLLVFSLITHNENIANYTCRRVHTEDRFFQIHPMLVSSAEILFIVQESGRQAVIMAVNPRSVPDIIIPAIMQAAMDAKTPIMFELAASEINVEVDYNDLKKAYVGLTPAEFVEKIRYYAYQLGLNVPFAIHGDHVAVKKNTEEEIVKAEALVRAEVEAGFSSIALDPSHCMELDPLKLVERLNGSSLDDLKLIPDVADVLAQRIIDHGEFSSLEELQEIEGIGEATAAVITTYLELLDNINITARLAKLIPEGVGLEVEVGEIGHTVPDPENPEQNIQVLTTVLEATTFTRALQKRGINPDMLAIHNGTEHGWSHDADGNRVPQLGIDLQRTSEVKDDIAPLGVVPVQHGTSSTSPENLALFVASGIFKANVATNWQDIMLDNIPPAMRVEVEQWIWDNFGEKERPKHDSDQRFMDKSIKWANKYIIRGDFGEIPEANRALIWNAAYESAMEYFRSFNSVGILEETP